MTPEAPPPSTTSAPSAQPPPGRRPPGMILGLAVSDAKNEWILTLCLILAISAVLSPLLLLFGLKFGTIETLRQRLIEDPRNREIRPMASISFTHDWFEKWRARPEVGFLVPMTRQIASSLNAGVKKEGAVRADIDIIPSLDGDPLLAENGCAPPADRNTVLTHFAAETLGAKAGDTLAVAATRLKGGAIEKGELELKVSGVLPIEGGATRAMYVPLAMLENVERYKDGQAVPEYGWRGSTAAAYPMYNGLVVVLSEALSRVDEYQLRNNTGFTKVEKIPPSRLPETAGFGVSTNKTVYLLSTGTRPAGADSVVSVRTKLRGMDPALLPWVKPLPARLVPQGGSAEIPLELLALSPDELAVSAGITLVPPWKSKSRLEDGSIPLMLPEGVAAGVTNAAWQLVVTNADQRLEFPVTVVEQRAPAGSPAFVPAELAGVLRLFDSRNITYEPLLKEFILSRRGYAGFRMYARSIDDVDGLRRDLEATGLPVSTAAEQIQRVKQMDYYLTLIFWLIAVVGIAGSVASLVASLYASVERKKRPLSVLRLLGVSGPMLFRFPVYQGVLIASGGYLLALGFFHAMARTINHLFHSHLRAGESFCRLPVEHQAMAFGLTVLLAAFAAMIAVLRLARIEPAEALRDE